MEQRGKGRVRGETHLVLVSSEWFGFSDNGVEVSDSECFRFPSGVERPSGGDTHLVAVLRAFGFANSGVEVSNSEWFGHPIGMEKPSRG